MDIETIQKKAASEAINNTISMVETALGMDFPRGGTLSESRENMIELLVEAFRERTEMNDDATESSPAPISPFPMWQPGGEMYNAVRGLPRNTPALSPEEERGAKLAAKAARRQARADAERDED